MREERGAVASRAVAMRSADAARIEAALTEGRAQLLTMFAGFDAALGPQGLRIGFDPILNLPLWELGHIGWFEEWWIARNRDRARGIGYDAAMPRGPSVLDAADACYDSAHVPHASRWALSLPDAERTRGYLAAVREKTLALLRQSGPDDDALYFFRLVLFHEDMHREAWLMMAQHLGLELGMHSVDQAALEPGLGDSAATGTWQIDGGFPQRFGTEAPGFAFDNELAPHELTLEDFEIDRAPISWRRYLPFIEAGGYDDESHWSRAGWQWRCAHSDGLPAHLRCDADGGWQHSRFGHWLPLDLDASAVHLTAHEAAAWCRFAGRRLPTEFEWETAARLAAEQGERFDWGQVWEWTASPFAPYPGFTPHPYREYSEPFFDGRPVLRGGSWATAPHMRHPRYRNYFGAGRNDVFAGFRSCALR